MSDTLFISQEKITIASTALDLALKYHDKFQPMNMSQMVGLTHVLNTAKEIESHILGINDRLNGNSVSKPEPVLGTGKSLTMKVFVIGVVGDFCFTVRLDDGSDIAVYLPADFHLNLDDVLYFLKRSIGKSITLRLSFTSAWIELEDILDPRYISYVTTLEDIAQIPDNVPFHTIGPVVNRWDDRFEINLSRSKTDYEKIPVLIMSEDLLDWSLISPYNSHFKVIKKNGVIHLLEVKPILEDFDNIPEKVAEAIELVTSGKAYDLLDQESDDVFASSRESLGDYRAALEAFYDATCRKYSLTKDKVKEEMSSNQMDTVSSLITNAIFNKYPQ